MKLIGRRKKSPTPHEQALGYLRLALKAIVAQRVARNAYTGYKFFTRAAYDRLALRADGFAIEAELVGGLLRSGARIFEIPISYAARAHEEGKKIRLKDAFQALYCIIRYWLAD